MKILRLLVALLALSFIVSNVSAQDTSDNGGLPAASVYVTTQDFSSLRQGPGSGFTRLAVVPPVITIPAYGRTSDTRWIQVYYDGQMGWIASPLLVWSGDVINLPVDGVNPYPYIRRAAALGVTTRETPIYDPQVTPQDQVGTIPEGTEVELTGRLGGTGFFRFQIRYQGQLYWVGSWDIRVTEGDYHRLLDLAYLYPYGRLDLQLENNVAIALGSYSQILDVWQRLNEGSSVSCSPIPPLVTRIITDADAHKEVSFQPAVTALDSAITAINSAISAFSDLCAAPNSTLTPQDVQTQLDDLDSARRSLILVGSLLEPLRVRNPLLANADQNNKNNQPNS